MLAVKYHIKTASFRAKREIHLGELGMENEQISHYASFHSK